VRPRGVLKYLYHRSVFSGGAYNYAGTRIYFEPNSLLLRILCDKGVFEPAIIDTLQRLATTGTMFDVGANIGLMAAAVLAANSRTRVVSFEASPSVLRYLRRSVEEGSYHDRWQIVPRAVADKPGTVNLTSVSSMSHDSLFDYIALPSSAQQDGSQCIPATTLDLEWRRLGSPQVSVVKLDVEGAEGLVFRGAAELILNCRPIILTEWCEKYLSRFNTRPESLWEIAMEYNYRLVTVPNFITVQDAVDLQLQMGQYSNFLMIPRQKQNQCSDFS
jgi:FkbM family methyltransferase